MKLMPGISFSRMGAWKPRPAASVSAPAQIQNPVGEDMPALQIGGQLHFVDGEKATSRSRGMASTVATQ
jgi:hypothetical protein